MANKKNTQVNVKAVLAAVLMLGAIIAPGFIFNNKRESKKNIKYFTVNHRVDSNIKAVFEIRGGVEQGNNIVAIIDYGVYKPVVSFRYLNPVTEDGDIYTLGFSGKKTYLE